MSTRRSAAWLANKHCHDFDQIMNNLALEWEDRDKSGTPAVREARDAELREAHAWRQNMLRESLDKLLATDGLQVKEGWGPNDWEMDLVPLEPRKED